MNKKNIVLISIMIIIILGIIIYSLFNNKEYEYNPIPIEENYVRENFKDNEYQVMDIADIDVYNKYYSEYLNLLLNNPEELFSKLTDSEKENYKNDVNEFKRYIKEIKTKNTKNNKIEKYNTVRIGNIKKIVIGDSENNIIKFYENAVNLYTIEIN